MSYTLEIIDAIAHDPPRNRCCKDAAACGLLAAKGKPEANGVSVQLCGESKIELACNMLAEAYGKPAKREKRGRCGGGTIILLPSSSALKYISNISENTPLINQRCPQCTSYFLRGLFVGGGRIAHPKQAYRLEFSVGQRSRVIGDFFRECGLPPTEISRRSETLLLFRNSARIEEFFVLMGINKIAFDIMNTRIENELKSDIQRITNFETANISRAVDAREMQIALLTALKERNLFSSLPQELAQTAELRLKMPEASLIQLASASVPPLTKSGVTHRLARLTKIAHTLLGNKNE